MHVQGRRREEERKERKKREERREKEKRRKRRKKEEGLWKLSLCCKVDFAILLGVSNVSIAIFNFFIVP